MMRVFIIYLNMLLLSACLLFGCSRRSSNPLLLQADSLLSVRPDSVLAMLDSLSGVEDISASDRAFYALLWAQALDKAERALLPCDSLLEFALDYYDDDDLEKAVALLYKGRLLAQMNDEKAAIELNLKALDILKEYPEDTQYRGLIYSALELWYGNSGLYNKALEMFNLLLAYSSSVKDTAIGYNNIGRIYIMRDMQDSAIFYQRKSMEYAAYSKNTDILSSQQKVDKKERKVMTGTELEKLKRTVFEIYADYISPLQAQYPRLTEDDLLLLCLQEADIPALTIALCFGHADTFALNQRRLRLKAKML